MTFGGAAYITIGDEYDKKTNPANDRFKGKSFITNPGRKGAGMDALFSKKFLSLSEGDKYVDPGTYDKRHRLESEKKKLTPDGFRYTSAPKKPTGAGSYAGCFTSKPEHQVEFPVIDKKDRVEAPTAHLKNITTNPAKRGTYGTPGISLSRGDEYKYISDPYEGERRKEALAAKENSKKLVGPAFKGACKRGGFFDESAHGISKVYSIDRALPAKKVSTEDRRTPLTKSWKPAGRLVDSITKFPEYQEDPYEAKERAMHEARKRDKPLVNWKPIGGSKSMPTRPIKFTPA